MSDPQNKQGDTGYSAEYVKTLRDEAASWRTKLRETEQKVEEVTNKVTELETAATQKTVTDTIATEITSRNLKIDPSFVKLEENQTPKDAVDKFLKAYPQFGEATNVQPEQKAPGKSPMPPKSQNTNIENTAVSELDAIQKDPIARSKLRNLYRGLLAQSAGTSNTI